MAGQSTMAQEAERILERLKELEQLDFPQYRSYRRSDGTWADREPVPEYLEQQELIRRWRELHALQQALEQCRNPLLISLHLWSIANSLSEAPAAMDIPLLSRIAISVYQNTAIS